MGGLLVRIGSWFMGNFIARVLLGAGLVLVTNLAFETYIHYFLNKAFSLIPNIPASGLLGLAGIDDALSVLISALLVRAYLFTLSQGVRVVKK